MKRLVILLASLALIAIAAPAAQAQPHEATLFYYDFLEDGMDSTEPNLAEANTTVDMTLAGDYQDGGGPIFEDANSPYYSVGYADVQSGSGNNTAFTLNAAGSDALSLTAEVYDVTALVEDSLPNNQTANVAQVGRSGGGGTDASCQNGGGGTCYGQIKIQLTDPDQDAGDIHFECLVRGGQTSEVTGRVTSSLTIVPSQSPSHAYRVMCIKDADGGSDTGVRIVVWDYYDEVTYDDWDSSPSPIGPVRTKLFLSAANKWQSPAADDQYTGGYNSMWVCLDDEALYDEEDGGCAVSPLEG